MLEMLMEEYKKELDAFKEYELYKNRLEEWKGKNPGKYTLHYHEKVPVTNRAKLKRLGIMIRAEMIEIERDI